MIDFSISLNKQVIFEKNQYFESSYSTTTKKENKIKFAWWIWVPSFDICVYAWDYVHKMWAINPNPKSLIGTYICWASTDCGKERKRKVIR